MLIVPKRNDLELFKLSITEEEAHETTGYDLGREWYFATMRPSATLSYPFFSHPPESVVGQ